MSSTMVPFSPSSRFRGALHLLDSAAPAIVPPSTPPPARSACVAQQHAAALAEDGAGQSAALSSAGRQLVRVVRSDVETSVDEHQIPRSGCERDETQHVQRVFGGEQLAVIVVVVESGTTPIRPRSF
ncbi:unnamed protein product [Heligmosomoides polygyrus]|uniref:Os08g0535700 protein n=1 Tax=Heligmosomoides polygyrus TaxID=6339 RepID=A0A183FFW0_HELPZ|nr:unnamed protein product [Heligmosomoides polygyrus]